MSERYCNKCGYFGPDEIHNKPGHLYQCGYLSSPIQQPDTIQVSRAEYEALQELSDAFKQNNRAFRNIETGEIKYLIVGANTDGWEDVVIIPDISNAAIDAAINMPANGEGNG
jgi:hypothetical protein